MAILKSQINVGGEGFQTNRAEMLALLDGVRTLERRVVELSAASRRKFQERGQMLPRERIAYLLDSGSPFLELSTLAGLGIHDDDGHHNPMGGGIITGMGYVSGVRCMVIAHDSGIKGGILMPIGVRKTIRAQEIAQANRLPVVYLVESGGGNLRYQFEAFSIGGGVFKNQSRMSAAGIPQISVVHGSATAGGAYMPGLSDYLIMVRNRAKVFLAGPPLLRAATGEVATDEELGGAELHAMVSGVCDYMVEDDREGLDCVRRIVAALVWDGKAPHRPYEEPRYSPDELAGVVPVDFRRAYDVREVIARLVDNSDFHEFKTNIGIATVCGQANIEGYPVGIIGNNGPIDADGAAKGGQFIQLMCQANSPILYLHNITGFMVGTDAERRGIVKHGSKMIQAVSNATVPQISLMMGASFGAGNYGMCGRGFDPDFIFAWPNNRTATMGGEQAAKVMTIIAEDRAARDGKTVDRAALDAAEKKLIAQFEHESTALYATARMFDDGIIDPRDTRKVLAFCLATCREGSRVALNPNTFGVGRL
ncbi:carboxyl transferase domain-containing protein [Magnetospirillum sp. 15-1]|uniref:acyl-CoA carboxylase subunit beta n=1 Tax=Magnetospirillum sp. 15-1 TaxID=1979370 RepID=UPI000BBBFE05|nr:carboxyl transferase domain-containing protein [Magnetospirillum sp. 15-1]